MLFNSTPSATVGLSSRFFNWATCCLPPAWRPGNHGTTGLASGLLVLLALGLSQPARAQTNRFRTYDDSNQVPANTPKSGNVIPNDDNPDNLSNNAFNVTLVAPPTNGTLTRFNADGSYEYTPNPGYLGPDSFTYQICVPGATPACSNVSTVRLNVYDPALVCTLGTGRNLLANPSFTLGNTAFSTSYTFIGTASRTPGLYAEGTYAVNEDANVYHGGFQGRGRSGQPGDKFMIVNGAGALVAVYSQTVRVLPNRYYSFAVYGTSLNSTAPAQLGLVVDGKSTSAVTTLPTTVGTYVRIEDLYFSGPGPATGFDVTIEIRDINKLPTGNDFGIDDLYFGSCSAFLTADTKETDLVPNVPTPSAIVPLSATISAGGSVGITVASFTIQSLPPTGVLYYNGVPVTVGQVIPVAPGTRNSGGSLTYMPAGGCAAASTSFTYTATDSDGNESNNVATYTIPVGPVPPPTVRAVGDNPFCVGQSVQLRTRPRLGYLFTWYNGSTVVNGAGNVLNDSVFVATTPGSYSVKTELASCAATSAPLSVTTKVCSPPAPCSLNEQFINTWYFGTRAGLSFNAQAPPARTPAVLLDGQMTAPEGTCSLSDDNGNLLFYTNGTQVWNRNHVLMPNGSGLAGNVSSTDGSMAIRLPGSTTRYYLFTQDSEGNAGGLSYSEIDMTLNGGLGDVVAATKNTPLVKRTTEKMTAVLHANGCDSWIIVHGWGDPAAGDEPGWPAAEHRGDVFLAFQVTPAGVVTTPVVSRVGPVHAASAGGLAFNGQLKASPDGRQLALARFGGTVELYAFDAATGAVSAPRTLASGGDAYYGIEFSPGRNKLYATILSPPQLLQFDLAAADIPASKKVIATGSADLGSIQAGPDGKLYVTRRNQSALGVITYPDSLGSACAYVDQGQELGGRLSGLGLPNFNQSFLVKVGFSARATACLAMKFEAGTNIPNPGTYTWNFGDPASGANNSSSIAEPTHLFSAPGEYTITLKITKSCLCKEIRATVVVPGAPTAGGIGADQTLCPGALPAPLTSTAPAGAGTGKYTYQWESSPDGNTWADIGGATGVGYAPSGLTRTTHFRRRVTSGFCTPATTAPVTITVLPPLDPGRIADNQTVCAGTAPQPLTSMAPATGGIGTFTYQWESSPDNSTWTDIAGATGADYPLGLLTATTYFRRRVTSGTGSCATAFSGSVAVRVEPLLATAVTLAPPPVQCPGTALTFNAVATDTGPAPTYSWTVNNTPVASGPTFTSSTLVTGDQVKVTVTPTVGRCNTGPATATVTVNRVPTVAPTVAIQVAPNVPVCQGDLLTFSIARVTDAGPTPAYQWQVDGVDVPGAQGQGPTFSSTTLRNGQTVTLRLLTTTSCGAAPPATSNAVAVAIGPPVDVDAGPDQEILAGESVVLQGRADGNYPVVWTPTTGLTFSGSDRLHPRASPTVTTVYTLSAGTGTCADASQVRVVVRPPIRIPNAFTPNGDGRDDTWQIERIEDFPNNTVNVYNRWGNPIFSASNYGRGNEWRGDINGQPAPMGTYYYVVVTKGPNGRSYSGSLTILY
ncbi:gliding motility-associated C-terminal domain-containing protein [Hymenobacter sp. BT664]|uniref:Gliding motility-associated C-terminal domain-containing protein n=1 Tax=Hymenobacter montanus TaxID=2771359 RepID=A0A927B9V0_9BACT|nr:gliding motility-associated C-terminal domain-containing protein [Hymenobacter montanus]MBD2766274.1 gliding motility-associated C-terminal domain-containing protein [Hymenobacter montanus]